MKKFKLIILGMLFLLVPVLSLSAASFSMTASTSQVSPGSQFTIRVGGDCFGKVNFSVSNGTLSTSSVWIEQDYITLTVTAGSSGLVSVTATPEIGFSDADANEYYPGPRTVTVNISSNAGSTNTPNKPTNNKPSVTKSNNNNLSSLTVNNGELSPSFDSLITEYTLNLPHNATSVNISASPSDSKASIEGIGEKSLVPGNNHIEIIVIAENGDKKTYNLNICR